MFMAVAMYCFPASREQAKQILTIGTRDLLLSNTVRVHRKFRVAGVEAQLEVYEGQSHAQYQSNNRAPDRGGAYDRLPRKR
jgi:acetyl esterase/lipase